MKRIIQLLLVCIMSLPCFSQGQITRQSANTLKERQFSIDEYNFKAKYYLQASEGEMYVTTEQDGQTYREFLDISKRIPIERAFDQYEGICYFWAASYVGDHIVSSNGFYSKEIMNATLSLLKKSMDFFSVSKGNCPTAYSGTKSRYDMLLEISKKIEHSTSNIPDSLLGEIGIIIWGMGENPVELCDVKSQM